MKNKHLPFYLIALTLFIGITGPALLSDGMFVDGLYYAIISNNLANNLGSFWDLHLTETLYPHFHEHPPLAFGIQSLFYRLLGDGIFVERFYSIFTFFITGWIITRIWRQVADSEFRLLAWLPLLLWASIPLVTWAAANNMLENTMMIFTSLSILYIIKSSKSNRILYLLLAGVMIFLGFMTKGPVALFPLAMLFWIFVFNRDNRFKQFILDMLVLVFGMSISFLLLFLLFPESLDSIKAYYTSQIVRSADVQTVSSRFYILWRLLRELIPAAGILLLGLAMSYKSRPRHGISKWVYVMLALGLSGVIPVMISMKQSGFYILAAFPAFSIGMASFMAPRVSLLMERIKPGSRIFNVFKSTAMLLVAASLVISFSQVNKIGKERNEILDIREIMQIIPVETIISVQDELWMDWSLHGYFFRYASISLDQNRNLHHSFLLVKKDFEGDLVDNYKLIPVELRLFDLYAKELTE